MKKYKYVMVNNLTYLKTDEDGNDDGKIYEYNGDHSSFCDGILPDDLQEIKQTKEINDYKIKVSDIKMLAKEVLNIEVLTENIKF